MSGDSNLNNIFFEEEEEERRLGRGPNISTVQIDNEHVASLNQVNETNLGKVTVGSQQNTRLASSPIMSLTSSPSVPGEELDRGKRHKTQSVKLKEFIVKTGNTKSTKNQSSTSTYPIANYLDCERFSSAHKAYLAAITSGVEAKSFRQAVEDEYMIEKFNVIRN